MPNKISILNVARNNTYNPNIALLRIMLALHVLMLHMVVRYAFYRHNIDTLWHFEAACLQFFQSSGETNPAVIAFVTISGYCIHRSGLRLHDMDLKNFFLKRFFRIIPMLIFGTVLGVAVFTLCKHDPKYLVIANTTHISFSTLAYKLCGIFTFSPIDFETYAHLANGPLITCILELWLYLLYPLLLVFIHKTSARTFWIVLSVLYVSSLYLSSFNTEYMNWWYNGSLAAFMLYWWLGVYGHDNKNLLRKKPKLLGILYLLVNFLTVIYPNMHWLIACKQILLSAFIVSILYLFEEAPGKEYAKGLLASGYALYSIHVPLICLALIYNVPFILGLSSILFLGYIVHKIFELPMLELGKAISEKGRAVRHETLPLQSN